jgi:hypothetical protein
MNEIQLRNQFENLDRALHRNDRIAADMALMEINRMMAEGAPRTATTDFNGLPTWLRDIIMNRGVRLPSVEQALNFKRVVVSPRAGKSGYGISLEMKF